MAFNPDEARDPHGRWTNGATTEIDPRVTDVGGDQWNKDTAARLEKEYADVRPALDKLATEADGKEIEGHTAGSWDDLGGAAQEKAGDKYAEDNYNSTYESEVENWQSEDAKEEAKSQVANDDDWKHEWLADYLTDRIANEDPRIPYTADDLAKAITVHYEPHGSDKDPTISFLNGELMHPDMPGFDPAQATLPGIEPKQEYSALTDKMREEITKDMTEAFHAKAEDLLSSGKIEPPAYLEESAADSVHESWENMDDDAKFEYAKEAGLVKENEDDESGTTTIEIPNKFDPLDRTGGSENYTRTQGLARYMADERAAQLIAARIRPQAPTRLTPREADELYRKWRIENPGADISKYVESTTKPSGVLDDADSLGPRDQAWIDRMRDSVHEHDAQLWSGWKDSSTSREGALIQVAAADELGGRIRDKSLEAAFNEGRPALVKFANEEFKSIGGYEGVKAAVRAKWETTQYLLDKADLPKVGLYRGVTMPEILATTNTGHIASGMWTGEPATLKTTHDAKTGQITDANWVHDKTGQVVDADNITKDYDNALGVRSEKVQSPTGSTFTRLPDVSVVRNGAASTTTDVDVANQWKSGHSGKVVLRAEVPRTAIISVPAYGINVHSEHEVVIAGTAWHGWDAWHERAPRLSDVPLGGKPIISEHWDAINAKWEDKIK